MAVLKSLLKWAVGAVLSCALLSAQQSHKSELLLQTSSSY